MPNERKDEMQVPGEGVKVELVYDSPLLDELAAALQSLGYPRESFYIFGQKRIRTDTGVENIVHIEFHEDETENVRKIGEFLYKYHLDDDLICDYDMMVTAPTETGELSSVTFIQLPEE